jgi:DNA-binding transcriptional regulator YhcF (GntR family)
VIRLWLAHDGSVCIREQLTAQLLLGILSGRLQPGERLPSVRDLARRLKIHSNTVSAAYRDLTARGWVEARRGSGVFVKAVNLRPPEEGIRTFVSAWVEEARSRGYSVESLQAELARERWQPTKLLVADPDFELARILAAEISEAAGVPVAAERCAGQPLDVPAGTCVLVNSGHASQIARLLGSAPIHAIQLKSMQEVVAGRLRPAAPVLIGVVSRSTSVLAWATPLLAALGFPPESVLLRDPSGNRWQEGLEACDIIASDVCAMAERPATQRDTVFRIVSDESLAAIRQLVTA